MNCNDIRRAIPALLATALVSSCSSHSSSIKMGAQSSNASDINSDDNWRRCENKVVEAQCPPPRADDRYGIGRGICVSGLLDKYRSATDRPAWLVLNGCPKEMVTFPPVAAEVASPDLAGGSEGGGG